MYRAIVIIALAAVFLLACGPPKCPTVPEESGKGFEMDYTVENAVHDAIKSLLADPGSYENDRIYASRFKSQEREDGSHYYYQVDVEFRARNAYGGTVRGVGWVGLYEDPDAGCVVDKAHIR